MIKSQQNNLIIKQKKWQNLPYWIYGGIIGLIISIFCGYGYSIPILNLLWFYIYRLPDYALEISGLDFFFILFDKELYSLADSPILFLSFGAFLLGSMVIILFGIFVGFLFDKKYSWKKKLIFAIILLVIFAPLSGYSHYLKYKDKTIIEEHMVSGTIHWKTVDIGICDEISGFNKYRKYSCYLSLIKTSPTLELCNKLKEGYDRGQCYISLADIEDDITICEKIEEEAYKQICYRNLASTVLDEKLCGEINTKEYNSNEMCYTEVAKIKKDPTLCQDLGIGRNICYQELAVVTNNPLLCEELTEGQIMFCYAFVASKLNDLSICENVKNEALKNECYIYGVKGW